MVVRVREVVIERHGDLKLVVGGKHGYVRVRGGQGSNKNLYQGYTVDKKHFTAGYPTAREAAIALAELERDLAMGLDKAAMIARKVRAGACRIARPRSSSPFFPCSLLALLTVSYCIDACGRSGCGRPSFLFDTGADQSVCALGAPRHHAAI